MVNFKILSSYHLRWTFNLKDKKSKKFSSLMVHAIGNLVDVLLDAPADLNVGQVSQSWSHMIQLRFSI